jgi:hypothetical protein
MEPILYSLLIYDDQYDLKHSNYNLDNFFIIYRSNIKDSIEHISAKIISLNKRTGLYRINENIYEKNFTIYIRAFDKYNILVLSNEHYPQSTVLNLFHALRSPQDLTKRNINDIFKSYQNPRYVDKIYSIRQEINENKIILLDSIDKLLEREEKLDELICKTEKLQVESFALRKEAEELNKCCIIL